MAFKDTAQKPLHVVFNKTKRIADVGIELEVEGTYLPSSVPHWNSKAEGSLQNGIEYITKPIKADAVETYVTNLSKYLAEVGAVVKPSYRCSSHVHINMLPEKVEDILGFSVIFTMFEPVLLALCGPQRDGNLFCLSTYDTGDIISSFDLLCRQFDRAGYSGFGFDRGKYSALNFGRLADLGTLEVRSFPLSMGGATVSKWVSWLLTMKDMAVAEPDKTYRTLWKNVRQNPRWYAMKVFGMDIHQLPNVSSLVDMGTEGAYELTKILKTWYAKEEKKKPLLGKTASQLIVDDLEGSF